MHVLYIRSLCSKIVLPIIKELPIIITFFFLIKGSFLDIQNNDMNNEWDYVAVFAIWFLYAYFIAAIICVSGKSWVRWLWYVLLYFVFAVSCFISTNFEMKISPTLITLLVETNEREASEFLETYLLSVSTVKLILKLFIYVVFTILIEKGYRYILAKKRQKETKKKGNIWASLLVIILLVSALLRWIQFGEIFRFANPGDAGDRNYPANDIYTRLICSLCIEMSQSAVFERAIDVSLNADAATVDDNVIDSLNVVLVIGESFIKSHASIYGYPLNTTPNMRTLEEKGNLFPFTDVISPYNYTSMALKNMMSCNSIADGEQWSDCPYFPILFRKGGYDVYFWSNQRDFDTGSTYEYALNSYLYDQRLSDYTYTKTNKETFEYDGQLIEDFKKFSTHSPALIMFHLMGQHIGYEDRFPKVKEHIKFTPSDIKRDEPYIDDNKRQLIANYDNATLYCDFVLNQIIECFEGRNAVLVFLSDHGEEVFDYRDRMGRSYTDKLDSLCLKYQYEIPFVIWCSDLFKTKNPDVVNNIQEATDRPFMIDNICQVLFRLGGIHTTYYYPERDMLSPDFVPKERIIKGGEINYDGILKK